MWSLRNTDVQSKSISDVIENLETSVLDQAYVPTLGLSGRLANLFYKKTLDEPMTILDLRTAKSVQALFTFTKSLQANATEKLSGGIHDVLDIVIEGNIFDFPSKKSSYGGPDVTPEKLDAVRSAIGKLDVLSTEARKTGSVPSEYLELEEILNRLDIDFDNRLAAADNCNKILNGIGRGWTVAGTTGLLGSVALPVEVMGISAFISGAIATSWYMISFANMPKDGLGMAMRVTNQMWNGFNMGLRFTQFGVTGLLVPFAIDGGQQLYDVAQNIGEQGALIGSFMGAAKLAAGAMGPLVMHKIVESMVRSSATYDFCDLLRTGANIVLEEAARTGRIFNMRNNDLAGEVKSLTQGLVAQRAAPSPE